MNPYDLMHISIAVQQMRENSVSWYDAEPAEQNRLSEENKSIAGRIKNLYHVPVMRDDVGNWHIGSVDGPLLYDLY